MSKEMLNRLDPYGQAVVKKLIGDVAELKSWLRGNDSELKRLDLVAYALIESTIRERVYNQQLAKVADLQAVYDEVLITQQLASDEFYKAYATYVGEGRPPMVFGFGGIPMLADEDDDDDEL